MVKTKEIYDVDCKISTCPAWKITCWGDRTIFYCYFTL